MKSLKRANKFALILSILMLVQPFLPAFQIITPKTFAQEATQTATLTDTITPSPTPPLEQGQILDGASTIATPSASPWTVENVELHIEYIAPQNNGVTLTFTSLPNPPGNIKIEELTLTKEQIEQIGSVSDKAYNITSDMTDGSFSYNLSLPIPESSKGKSVEVKFAEDILNIGTAEKVENALTKTDTSVSVRDLDHFTIFVVVNPSPPPVNYLQDIVDNSDPGFEIVSGSWRTSTSVSGYYGAHYITTDNHTGIGQIRWNFTPTQTGTQEIFTRWTTAENRGTAVPFTITHDGGSTTVTVNQEVNNGTWMTLGTYSFTAGTPYSVTLTNNSTNANDFVIGDAIKLQNVSDPLEVWVDDSWAGTSSGTDLGSGKIFGYSAFTSIQNAITAIAAGGTMYVAAGTYTEVGQIVIDKNLSIVGEDTTTTILKTNQDTGSTGNARAWILVRSGATFNVSKVTFDGTGHKVREAIRQHGNGTIEDSVFTNIQFGTYLGTGIHIVGTGHVDVTRCNFSSIERVGVLVTDSATGTFSGNTYTGRGVGDWLDYAFDIQYGAHVTIDNNTISNTHSAGISVWDDPGTQATITNNTFTNNHIGVAVVVASGGTDPIITIGAGNLFHGGDIAVDMELNTDWGASWGSPTITFGASIFKNQPTAINIMEGISVGETIDIRNVIFKNSGDVVITDSAVIEGFVYDLNDSPNRGRLKWDYIAPTVPVGGTPHAVAIPTNNFDFHWDTSTDVSSVTYEYQASLNPAEIDGVLTTGLWHSGILPSNMIHSSGAPDGIWYWQVRAIDSYGNTSAWSTIWNVRIDTIAPAFDSQTEFSGWYTSDQTSYFNYSDLGSGIASGNPSSCIIAAEGVSQTCSVTPHVCDNAGNCNGTPVTSSGADIDKTNPTDPGTPTPDVSSPTNSTSINWVWTTASDAVSGVKHYLWQLWDSTIQILSGTTTSTGVSTLGLIDETYTMKVTTGDTAGNQSGQVLSSTVTVDTTSPNTPTYVSSSHTTSVWNKDRSITISWIATDPAPGSGIAGYSYIWNTTANFTPDTISEGAAASTTSSNQSTGQSIYFHVRAVDALGQWGPALDYGPFWIDAANPTNSWVNPLDGAQVSGIVHLQVQANDVGSGLKLVRFRYQPSGGAFVTIVDDTSTPYSTNWDTTSVANGSYVLRARAEDNSGRTNIRDITVTVDNIAPTVVSVDSDEQTYNLATASPHTGTVTFSENITNTPTIGVNGPIIDPQTVHDCSDGDAKTFCFNYTIPTPQEMEHTIHISGAQDIAGNTMTENNSHTFTVDTIAPIITIAPYNTLPTNEDVTVTATTNEGTLHTGSHTFSANGSFDFVATDAAENVTTQTVTITNIDKTAPAIPIHVSPADDSHLTTAALTAVDWSDVTDINGPVIYYYQSSHSSSTNPDGTFTTPAYTSGALTNSHIPASGTPAGVYYWHIKAADTLSNASNWSTPGKITVDNSTPTVDLVFPAPGPTATSFQAVFSENVKQSEAENPANIFLNNWPGAGGSGNLSNHADVAYNSSTHTATVTFTTSGWYISPEQEWGVQDVHDLAGNIMSVNPYSETSTPMVAPITTDSGTDADWHNTSVTVHLSCTDTGGSGCKQTYYTTDGTPPTTSSSFGNSLTLSTDGIYTIQFFSVDNAGNVEDVKTASHTVKIDNTAPTIPAATPPAGDYLTDQLVTLDSSDSGSGLENIYYTLDGTTPDNTKTLYAGAITVDKDMTIKAVAYDNAGNTSDMLTATYGIAPVISGESFSRINDTTLTVNWFTDDPSTSRVVYDTTSHAVLGADPNYGYAYSTVEDPTKVTAHSVSISGLTPYVTYYYRVISHGSPETVGPEQSHMLSYIMGGASDGLSDGKSDGGSSGGGGVQSSNVLGVAISNWGADTTGDILGTEIVNVSPTSTVSPTIHPTPETGEVLANSQQVTTSFPWIWIVLIILTLLVLFFIYKRRK